MPSSIQKCIQTTSNSTKQTTVGQNLGLGGNAWSNGKNIQLSDDTRATVILGSGQRSDWLYAKNFQFSIPANADILGIQLQIERTQLAISGGPGAILDSGVMLVSDVGSLVGANKASGALWGVADSTVTYGGSSDSWSAGWNPQKINSFNFGCAVACKHNGSVYGSVVTPTGAIDQISILVSYEQRNVHNKGVIVLTQKGAVGDIVTLRDRVEVFPDISGVQNKLNSRFDDYTYYSA